MSQVTAPILLDSTGQDISAKLQAIANAINGGTIDSITITQDGTYTPSGTTLGYGPVIVNVGGGGSNTKGFELYGAGNGGGTQTFKGRINNNYMSCCFHDNMSASYTINGVNKNFTKSESGFGSGMLYGTTIPVSDNTDRGLNAVYEDGSIVVSTHNDSGSYLSVVGGWIGYPSGGTIYENVSSGSTNTITLNSAHSKLLVFVGASARGLGGTTIDINNNVYNVTNIGTTFDSVYSLYAAIEIDGNTDTTITVTFPTGCYNYVSIIGL